MVTKCANPACGSPFQYLRGGRLYCFELRRGTLAGSTRKRLAVYFWICECCSETLSLEYDMERGVFLKGLWERDVPARHSSAAPAVGIECREAGNMLKATDVLEQENRTIEKVLTVMARILQQFRSNQRVEADILRDLLEFFRIFYDQYHQGREESFLFPLLQARGVPSTGYPVAALKAEHKISLQLVEELSVSTADHLAGVQLGLSGLINALHNLISFLPGHIWKEDYLLLPMAEKILSATDQEKLLQQFDLAELDMGGRINAEFEALAHNLAERVASCPCCSLSSAAGY